MPSIIYPLGFYHDALREIAWTAAGWFTRRFGDDLHCWGPKSTAPYCDLDVARMCGCLDAQIEEPKA